MPYVIFDFSIRPQEITCATFSICGTPSIIRAAEGLHHRRSYSQGRNIKRCVPSGAVRYDNDDDNDGGSDGDGNGNENGDDVVGDEDDNDDEEEKEEEEEEEEEVDDDDGASDDNDE